MKANIDKSVVGGRIKIARSMKLLTQAHLGKLVGVSREGIWKYENSYIVPSAATVFAIARHTDVTPQWIAGIPREECGMDPTEFMKWYEALPNDWRESVDTYILQFIKTWNIEGDTTLDGLRLHIHRHVSDMMMEQLPEPQPSEYHG